MYKATRLNNSNNDIVIDFKYKKEPKMFKELIELANKAVRERCETQSLRIVKVASGTAERLFATLSAFSNQPYGGTILFGMTKWVDT
jgi:hypothetical protein